MTCNKIVIISDSPEMRVSLERLVTQAGLDAETVNCLGGWLLTAQPECTCCLVLDMAVGDLNDPDRIAEFQDACSSQPVLVLAHAGDVPTAVQAIRQGAEDVIQKPIEQAEIMKRIERILAKTT